MRRLARPFLLVALVGVMLMLAQDEALSQGRNKLPAPRPPIFLNNNASLYTFPNPNFGKPGQLPFSFVAVAHEDCRLYHNGALLMPNHRMMAANCCINRDPMTGQCLDVNPSGGGGGVVPPGGGFGICPDGITPVTWVPELGGGLVAWCPDVFFPGGPGFIPGPGVINGYNNRRRFPMYEYPSPNGGNYSNYNPGAGGTSASPTTMASSRAYRGFGTFSETSVGGFHDTVGTDPSTKFGRGFGVYYPCCGSQKPEKPEAPEAAAAEPAESGQE